MYSVLIHGLNVVWKRHVTQLIPRNVVETEENWKGSEGERLNLAESPVENSTENPISLPEVSPGRSSSPEPPDAPLEINLRRSERIRKAPVRYGFD